MNITAFDRYNIVSQEDLREAARKQQAYLGSQNSYNLVTIGKKIASRKKRPAAEIIDFIGAWGRNRTGTEHSSKGF